MTEKGKLFRPGKRYRGFAYYMGGYLTVTMTISPIGEDKVKIRYLFPTKISDKLKEGELIYVLIEDKGRLIAELRITQKDDQKKLLVADIDFVTEDRRKLPRVKVKDLVDVEVEIDCDSASLTGRVIDISMVSFSAEVQGGDVREDCVVKFTFKNLTYSVHAKKVRSQGGVVVMSIEGGNGSITELLTKIYAELFLRAQRKL